MNITYRNSAASAIADAVTTIDADLLKIGTVEGRIVANLKSAHEKSGTNEPLHFDAEDADKVGYEAARLIETSAKRDAPKKGDIETYDRTKTGKFHQFNTRHNNMKNLVAVIDHYDAGLAMANELFAANKAIPQTGGSYLTACMKAISKGTGADYKATKLGAKDAAKVAKDKRDVEAKKSEAHAVTLKGYQERLAALIDEATDNGMIIEGEIVFKPPLTGDALIENHPAPTDSVPVTQDDIMAMMGSPAFGQLMAAFGKKS
jgi:hypothetical protein